MIQRSIHKEINAWVGREEIIFLNGPRQVGKTTLMKQFQKELETQGKRTFFFNLENPNDLALTEDYEYFRRSVAPKKGKVIVFLDEIQHHSKPSNFLKWLYDEHRSNIKLFVSGSANLDIKAKLQDSLVGRKRSFLLEPFNFTEFLEAKEFSGGKNPITDEKQLKILMDEYLTYGGLPAVVLENDISLKRDLLNEYTATYINKDIRHMIAENHVVAFNNLLIFLAKITGSLKNNSEIQKELGMNHITINRYLDLLRHTFVVYFLQPYFTNEITRLKKASKVYFFDTGVRNSLLSNFAALNKRNDSGALFENVVYLHLLQQYDKNHVFYLRTISDNEIDFICQTNEGELNAYEAKYSQFKMPTIPKGLSVLLHKIHLDHTFIINQNLTQKKGGVDFMSFEKFVEVG